LVIHNSPFPAIYSFSINVNTSERFTEQPYNIVYFPVVKFLVDSIKFWVSDQDGNLGGQNLVARSHFKYLLTFNF